MLKFAKNADAMREACKKPYDNHCIVTSMPRGSLGFNGPLDGAHVFAAGDFTELAKCIQNGLPICRYRHNNPFGFPNGDFQWCLDINGHGQPRGALHRVEWLVRWTHGDFRSQVRDQLFDLVYYGAKICQKVKAMEDDLIVTLEEM